MKQLLAILISLLLAGPALAQLSGKGMVENTTSGAITCDASKTGMRIYDTGDSREETCDGSDWVTSGGTGGTSTMDFLTTGTIRGNVHVVTTTIGTDAPSADEMRGTLHIAAHATGTSDVVYTLQDIDDVGLGASACFYDNGGDTGGIGIDPSATDKIMLDGVDLGAGNRIDSPGVDGAGANGDYICLLAIDESAAGIWASLGRSGVWELED